MRTFPHVPIFQNAYKSFSVSFFESKNAHFRSKTRQHIPGMLTHTHTGEQLSASISSWLSEI